MAEWRKVIVSGSQAELAALTASIAVKVGTNQQITTGQATTFLTGSFTGSFTGDGSGLTGVTATFPVTATTNLATADKIYVNDGANKHITYGNLLIDLAGTNLAVESTDSLTLASQISVTGVSASFTGSLTGALIGTASWANNVTTASVATTTTITDTTSGVGPYYITFVDATSGNESQLVDSTGLTYNATTNTITATASYASQSLSSSFASSAPWTGITGRPSGLVSGSSLSSAAQGEVVLTTNGVAGSTVDLGLQTTDSPQFVGLTLTGDAAVNGGDITTSATSATVFNTNATTVNAFGAATLLNLGAATGTTNVKNDLNVDGNLYVQGTTTTINTANLYVEDQFILLASGSATAGDGGIVIDRGSDGSGNIAFGYDSATDRWGYQNGLTDTINAMTIGTNGDSAFAGIVFTETAHTSTKPLSGEFVKEGAIYTNTDGTIWMYA